jgi:hypothetical protein
VFNNAQGEFIAASLRMASASAAGSRGIERREMAVRLRDVRLVRPIDEHPGTRVPAAWRERIPARVVIDLDDWQVSGEIQLLDRIPWLDFMTAARNRFISVTNASVRFVNTPDILECEFLLVNGARVSALYEAP